MPSNKIQPFGTYYLSFVQRVIFKLVKLQIIRGEFRKITRKLWYAFPASHGHKIYDISRWNIRMRLHSDKNIVMKEIVLFNRKTHDAIEVNFFKQRMNDGDIFADIGANIGYWGLRIAEAFPNTKVLCFEPNPIMLEELKENIDHNSWEKNITVIPYAVSDKSGTANLEVGYSEFHGQHDYSVGSIDKNFVTSKNKFYDSDDKASFTIQIKSLKDCLLEIGIDKVDAMKLDIEGHEAKALMPYLRQTPKEKWPHTILLEYENSDCWEEDIVEFLLKNNFQVLLENKRNIILGS